MRPRLPGPLPITLLMFGAHLEIQNAREEVIDAALRFGTAFGDVNTAAQAHGPEMLDRFKRGQEVMRAQYDLASPLFGVLHHVTKTESERISRLLADIERNVMT